MVIEAPFGLQLDLHENEQTRGIFYVFQLGFVWFGGSGQVLQVGFIAEGSEEDGEDEEIGGRTAAIFKGEGNFLLF